MVDFALKAKMEHWVILCLTICFLHVISGEGDVKCMPGATIPHPKCCSKYYKCDVDNDPRLFVCPSDQLFNPETTTCDHADRVTCFGSTEVDEKTTSDCNGYRGNEEEVGGKQSSHRQESDLHKEFYLIGDSSDESSGTVETDRDGSSKEDEDHHRIIINVRPIKEDTFLDLKYKIHRETSERVKDKSKTLQFNSSAKALDEEPDENLEFDKSTRKTSVDSHERLEAEITKKDHDETDELKTDKPKHSNPDSRDTSALEPYSEGGPVRKDNDGDVYDSYEDKTYRLEKRDANETDLVTEGIESDIEQKSKNGYKVDEDKPIIVSVEHDKELNVEITSPEPMNSDPHQITYINGTSILRFGSLIEPIANWTETLQNGWTDLQIFYKHPEDKEFQGSVNFKYPADSVSDDLEMKTLVLEILKLREDEVASSETE